MDLDQSVKITIVGDYGVGKTWLLNAFLGKENVNVPSTTSPTEISRVVETSSGQKLKVMFWDTAGQEKYQSLNPLFTRGTDVAIVCYAAARPDSVEKWIRNVQESSPDAVFVAAVTKMDMIEQYKDAVEATEEKAKELVSEGHVIDVKLTSAKKESEFYPEITKLFGRAIDAAAEEQKLQRLPKALEPTAEPQGKQGCC
jgi:small GTP-binding protein